jgi:small conductance mechanosensitive channel
MNFDAGIGLIFEKLRHWLAAGVKLLPNFLLAFVILILSMIVARWMRRLSCKIVNRISKNEAVGGLVSVIVYFLIFIIGVMTALDVMGLEKTVSSLLAGVGIIGLALGFAFQDLTSNFISGVFMTLKRPFDVGHKIETNGFVGIVSQLQLRSTTLLTTSGLHVIIPNKDVFQKPIINYSKSSDRRVELEFSVAVTTELAYLESILVKAVQEVKDENEIGDVQFFYTAIEDAKVKVTLSFRIDNRHARGYMTTRHHAIVAVHKALSNHGIIQVTVPAPDTNESREAYGKISEMR